MNKKRLYFLEYQVKNNIYNYMIKAKSEDDVIKKFEKMWENEFDGVYPYPEYKIITIKKIMKKLKIYDESD